MFIITTVMTAGRRKYQMQRMFNFISFLMLLYCSSVSCAAITTTEEVEAVNHKTHARRHGRHGRHRHGRHRRNLQTTIIEKEQINEQQLVLLPTQRPFDAGVLEDCYNPIQYHYNATVEPGYVDAAKNSSEHFTKWHQTEFADHLQYGSMWDMLQNPRSMMKTLSKNGKFVYWRHHLLHPYMIPNIKMSLFNSTVISETGTLAHDGKAIKNTVKTQDNFITWTLERPAPKLLREAQKVIVLPEGPSEYIVFTAAWHTEYQHLLIDHIGYWAYLSQMFPSPDIHFIFMKDAHTHGPNKMLEAIDPDFAKRVYFIKTEERYTPFGGNQMFVAPPNTALSVFMPPVSTRHQYLHQLARQWTWNSPNLYHPLVEEQKYVIFYTRKPGQARLGRIMSSRQEVQMQEMIQESLMKHGRREKLVVFDGSDISFEEQVKLFRSASVIIGPHGGGLANVIFAPPIVGNSCDEISNKRIKMIEFVTSQVTKRVQYGIITNTYKHFFTDMPWVELHHVYYTRFSLDQMTYIDMDGFKEALENVLAPVLPSNTMVVHDEISL